MDICEPLPSVSKARQLPCSPSAEFNSEVGFVRLEIVDEALRA